MEVNIEQAIAIGGALIGIGGGGLYAIIKGRLSRIVKRAKAVTTFIDEVDKALYDDKIDEAEFRRIWEAGKGLKDAF